VSRAVLSIGSNAGDRLAYLQLAVDALRPWIVALSPVYETAAWGPVEQPDYLNAIVVANDPAAEPDAWLARGGAAETAAGRTRTVRWGPRTLDVDVIAVDATVRTDPMLTLPHPRAAQRAFVLMPWLAVDADAVLPEGRVADLVARLDAAEVDGVRPRADLALR
jgi:2-amino-4-hydroxy-6-hydroxymethyldihydropteridine diphosphokinase